MSISVCARERAPRGEGWQELTFGLLLEFGPAGITLRQEHAEVTEHLAPIWNRDLQTDRSHNLHALEWNQG